MDGNKGKRRSLRREGGKGRDLLVERDGSDLEMDRKRCAEGVYQDR